MERIGRCDVCINKEKAYRVKRYAFYNSPNYVRSEIIIVYSSEPSKYDAFSLSLNNIKLNITKKIDKTENIKSEDILDEIEKLKALMKIASNNLDFERCIEIRDTISKLKRKLRK